MAMIPLVEPNASKDWGSPPAYEHQFTRYFRTAATGNVTVDVSGMTQCTGALYGFKSYAELPNFHKRKNAGEFLPYTPYYILDHLISIDDGSRSNWISTTTGNEAWWESASTGLRYLHLGGPLLHTRGDANHIFAKIEELGIDPQYYVQAAAAKLYTSGWDGLTFLAEFHKVLSMFNSFLQNLAKLLSGGPKGKLDAWLEGRYGWRVLVYDMFDIHAAILNMTASLKRRKERVGSSIEHTETRTVYSGGAVADRQLHIVETYEIGVRGCLITELVPPRIQLNYALTAWELTRLSFVIDWVVNVSQSLQAMMFLSLQPSYTASYGRYCKYTQTGTSTVTYNPGFTGAYQEGFTESMVVKERVPCSIPALPLVKLRLDDYKIADLIAIITKLIF